MTARGPTTQSLDERIDGLTAEVKEVSRGMADLRTDLGTFQGGAERDLKWIKGSGARVLLIALGSAAWVIREITTLKDDVRHHDARLEKTDQHLDGIDGKLNILIRRTETKPGG